MARHRRRLKRIPKDGKPKRKKSKDKATALSEAREKDRAGADVPEAILVDVPEAILVEEEEPKKVKIERGVLKKILFASVLMAVLVAIGIFVYPPLHFRHTLSTIQRGTDTDRKWAAMQISDYGKDAVPPLLRLMETGDDKTGRYAAMALSRIGVLKEPLELVKSKRPQTRINALRVLARTQNGAARQAVVTCLEDEDPNVRRVASEWIGLSNIREGFDTLLKVINDDNGKVREKAAVALGMISDLEKVPILVELSAASDDPRVRSKLIAILTSRAFSSRAEDILKYIESKSESAGRTAGLTYVMLATKIDGPGGEAIVTSMLKHEEADVRAAAVAGVVELDLRQLSLTLVNMVLADTKKPCEAATKGLLDFGTRGHEDTIMVALNSPDEFRRYCGLRILTMTAKPILIKPALGLLGDPSARVSKAAHEALIAAVEKKYALSPKVEPTKSSWENWFRKIDKELEKLRAIDDKMSEIRQLISQRTGYKRAEQLCKELEVELRNLETELIVTPKRAIEDKLTLLSRMRYQAFKMQKINAR